jgi:hypothetical protein
MCQRITCSTCGKPTWAGCGQHVEQALAGVPSAQRCQGHASESGGRKGVFASLFGR